MSSWIQDERKGIARSHPFLSWTREGGDALHYDRWVQGPTWELGRRSLRYAPGKGAQSPSATSDTATLILSLRMPVSSVNVAVPAMPESPTGCSPTISRSCCQK